ncbi:hypothetical protein [Lysinibacillus pakistanensis]|uniref:hypothetical protein n=1 Tax=Lysinibacillus pakistanensis TaxID=759811 RepID=UPI003D2B3CF7
MSMYGIRNRPDFVNYVSSLNGTRQGSNKHSTTNKRYYSSIDAEIYFGDFYIDEITHIAYTIQQNVMPLYGYNSYVYDEMAIGSRIINGQFTINFTKSNYLIELLQKLESSTVQLLGEKVSKEDDGQESDVITGQSSTSDNSIINKRESNDTYMSTNYDGIRQSKRPLWFTGFDIDVMFGRASSLSSKTDHVMLEGVYLVSSMLNLDQNGQPVSETYTFIARDVRNISI